MPLAQEHLALEIELGSDFEVMRYLTGRASARAEVEAAHPRRRAAAHEVPGLGLWVGCHNSDFIGWWSQPRGEVEYEISRATWQHSQTLLA